MVATITRPARIPFDYWQFFNAMIGLLGREPDRPIIRHGLDGFFDHVYKPKNNAERKKLQEHTYELRQWLDKYDITFSDSCCEYRRDDPVFGEHLRVMIKHPVTAKTTKAAESLHCNIR